MKLQVDMAQDHILGFSRSFPIPVEALYQAWTDPEKLTQWWGPKGFTLTINRYELRIGGIWDYILHGPDGTDYPNQAVFEVIEPNRRLVFSNIGGHVEDAHLTCRMVVRFAEAAEGAKVELRMIFDDLVGLEAAKARGAKQGGEEAFDRLAIFLKQS